MTEIRAAFKQILRSKFAYSLANYNLEEDLLDSLMEVVERYLKEK